MTLDHRAAVAEVLQRLVRGDDAVPLSLVLRGTDDRGLVNRKLVQECIRSHGLYRIMKRGRGHVVVRRASKKARVAAVVPVQARKRGAERPIPPPRGVGLTELMRTRLETALSRHDVSDNVFPNYATAWALLDIADSLRRAAR